MLPDDPASFGHIDDVCIQLLKQGNNAAALKYLQRMRAMIDGICLKMGGHLGTPDPNATAPKRGSRSARGPRERPTRSNRPAVAPEPPYTARSLPAIGPAAQVDTAAERIAAKDAHIKALKAKVEEFEEVGAAETQALTEQRAVAASATAKLKKREAELRDLRRKVRVQEGELIQSHGDIDSLRAELHEKRQAIVQSEGVSPDEHEKQRMELVHTLSKANKLEGQIKQRDGKVRVLTERLEVAEKNAGANEAAVELTVALRKTQGQLKSKQQAAENKAKILEHRENDIKQLKIEVERLSAELAGAEASLCESQAELKSARRRFDAVTEDYRAFRGMNEKLTTELNETKTVLAERDSLRAQVADASNVVTKMAVKCEKLEHKLKASNVELHNSAKAMKGLVVDLSETKEKLIQKTADSVSMRKQTVAMRAEVERMKKTISEKDEYITRLSDKSGSQQKKLMDDLQFYRAEAGKVQGLESDLAAERQRVSEMQLVLEDLREQFDRQAKEHQETVDFIAERNSWARKVMRLSVEPQLLRQRLTMQTQTMRFLESEVVRLETDATMRQIVDQLADEHSLALTKELGQTRCTVATLRAESAADRKELAVRAATIGSQATQLSILETEVGKLRREEELFDDVAELKSHLAAEKLAVQNAQAAFEAGTNLNSSLTEHLSAARETATSQKMQIEELGVQLMEVKATCAQLESVATAAKEETAELQSQVVHLQSDKASLVQQRADLTGQLEDGKELQSFLLSEVEQLKRVGLRTREEIRQREDMIEERDAAIAAAAGELSAHLATMREQQDEAVAFESSERETMRLALTEIILHREATISDLCVSLSDTRAQANVAHADVARLEGLIASMEQELTEAVVPIVVTVEEQQAVAETVEDMISLIELLDRVDSRQTCLYPSGAATTNTPHPTATPDIVEHDYSRPMANPVVSVRMVRNKRLFSI